MVNKIIDNIYMDDDLYERILRIIEDPGITDPSLALEELRYGFKKLDEDVQELYEIYDLDVLFSTIEDVFYEDLTYMKDVDHADELESISNTIKVDFFERITDLDDKGVPPVGVDKGPKLLNQKTKLKTLLKKADTLMNKDWRLYNLSEPELEKLNKRALALFSSYAPRGEEAIEKPFEDGIIVPLIREIKMEMDINRKEYKWNSFSIPGNRLTEKLNRVLNDFNNEIDRIMEKEPDKLVVDVGREFEMDGEWQVQLRETPWLAEYRINAGTYLYMYHAITYEIVMILVENIIPMIKNMKNIADGETKLENSIGLIVLLKQIITKYKRLPMGWAWDQNKKKTPRKHLRHDNSDTRYFFRRISDMYLNSDELHSKIHDNKRIIQEQGNRPLRSDHHQIPMVPAVLPPYPSEPSSSEESTNSPESSITPEILAESVKNVFEGMGEVELPDNIQQAWMVENDKRSKKKKKRTKKKKKKRERAKPEPKETLVPAMTVSGSFFNKPEAGDYVEVNGETMRISRVEDGNFIFEKLRKIKLSEIYVIEHRLRGKLFAVEKELEDFNKGNNKRFETNLRNIKMGDKVLVKATNETPRQEIPPKYKKFTNGTDKYLLGTIKQNVDRRAINDIFLREERIEDLELYITYDHELLSKRLGELNIPRPTLDAMYRRNIYGNTQQRELEAQVGTVQRRDRRDLSGIRNSARSGINPGPAEEVMRRTYLESVSRPDERRLINTMLNRGDITVQDLEGGSLLKSKKKRGGGKIKKKKKKKKKSIQKGKKNKGKSKTKKNVQKIFSKWTPEHVPKIDQPFLTDEEIIRRAEKEIMEHNRQGKGKVPKWAPQPNIEELLHRLQINQDVNVDDLKIEKMKI